jgi:hypothetical protein
MGHAVYVIAEVHVSHPGYSSDRREGQRAHRGRRFQAALHAPPDQSLDYTLLLNPGLSVAEAFMDGDILNEDGTLFDFMEVAAINYYHVENFPLVRILRWIGIGRKKFK